jgi:hypothetical protein
MRPAQLIPLVLLAGAAVGCQSTFDRAAVQAKKNQQAIDAANAANRPLEVTPDATLKVLGTPQVIQTPDSTAVVLQVANTSSSTVSGARIALDLQSGAGGSLATNTASGTDPNLNTLPVLAAGSKVLYVNDGLSPSGKVKSVKVLVGGPRATTSSAAPPKITIQGLTSGKGIYGPQFSGTLVNGSKAAIKRVVVTAVATKGGAVVAAGTAAVPGGLPAGGLVPFQGSWTGNPKGAKVTATASAG